MSKYKLHVSLAFGLIIFGVVMVTSRGRAEAAAFSNSTSIPRYAIDAVEHNDCTAYGQPYALYQSSWISPPGKPKVTSTTPYIDVAKGQRTVHLWLNDLSAICRFGLKNGNVDLTKLGGIQATQFNTVSASVTGANGAVINDLAGSRRRVSYDLSLFNFLYMTQTPPPYLPVHTDFNITNLQAINSTASKEYTLNLEVIVRPVHQYPNGKFICVALGPDGKIETALDILGNRPGGKKCGTTSPDFSLKIKVADDPDRKPVGEVESTCSGFKITNYRDPDVPNRTIRYNVSNLTRGVQIVRNATGGTVDLEKNSADRDQMSVRFYNYRPDGTRDDSNDYIVDRTWVRPANCPVPEPSRVVPIASAKFDDKENPQAATLTTETTLSGPSFAHSVTREYYIERVVGGTKQSISENAPHARGASSPAFAATGSTGQQSLPIDAASISGYGLQVGDKICAKITVTPATSPGTLPGASESCDVYENRPFVAFYGGDVSVGGDFTGGTGSCSDKSKVATFNNASNMGSGVQFALHALVSTDVSGFTSARVRSSLTPPSPEKGLTFANTTAAKYGSDNSIDHCIPNYYGDVVTATSPFADTSTAVLNGPLEIANGVSYIRPLGGVLSLSGLLEPNKRRTVYVDGDLRITDNISYSGSWGSMDSIPSLHVFVKGNIYISPNVSDVTGMFVAQPVSPTEKGQIFTCANPLGVDAAARFVANTLWDNCRTNRLTIHGSFSAKKVHFDRVINSLRDATNEGAVNTSKAAEVFDFTPEHYLVAPGSSVPGGASRPYDFYTLLPPIL